MALAWLLAVLLVPVWPVAAPAHDLQHEVGVAEGAIAVRLSFADGNVFSFEAYEVYREGEDIPFQVGRTDALGRLIFMPDQPGDWRVKVFSEDGHGLDFSVVAGERGAVEKAGGSPLAAYSRLIVGVAVIFGIFGLLNLFLVRGKRE